LRASPPNEAQLREGVRLLNDECAQGLLESCVALAGLHSAGVGVEQDVDRAARLYDEACAAGSPEACVARVELFADPEGLARFNEELDRWLLKDNGLTGWLRSRLAPGPQD
jgi:TPR repeat protein